MNKNFQYLEEQFRGARKTNVNCGTSGNGSGINEAIENGYTDITITGICKENIRATVWRESTADNNQPSGKLAPRYLKITGANSSAKIVDATSNTETLIFVTSGATLSLKNLTLSGGQQGVVAARNSNLYLSNVRVENFTDNGIAVADSSWLGVDEGGVVVEGNDTGFGVYLINGASGWMYKSNISNVERGIVVYGGSFLYIRDTDISDTKIGIRVDASKLIKYEGTAEINSASDYGIWVTGNSLFKNSSGKLDINKSDKAAISLDNSQFLNDEGPLEIERSSNYPIVDIINNSYADIKSVNLVGSNLDLIRVNNSSTLILRDSTIQNTNQSILNLHHNSHVRLIDSTLQSSNSRAISLDTGSSIVLEGSTVEASSERTIWVANFSNILVIKQSTVLGNAGPALEISRGSYGNIGGNEYNIGNTVKRSEGGTAIQLNYYSSLVIDGQNDVGDINCGNMGSAYNSETSNEVCNTK